MRYAIKCTDEQELKYRLEYLEEIFKMKFMFEIKKDDFLIYHSFPIRNSNIFFIIGHCHEIKKFLENNKIKEKNVVINSCYPNSISKISKIKSKKIYFSKTEETGKNYLFNGSEYNLQFDITNSELDLLNSKKNRVIEKIRDSYVKL